MLHREPRISRTDTHVPYPTLSRASTPAAKTQPPPAPRKVLGIESSGEETGVAVYDAALAGAAGLRAHAVYSQIAWHAQYGGVVPELASRDHVRKLLPLIRQTLAEAGLERKSTRLNSRH